MAPVVGPKWTYSISLTGHKLAQGIGWCWLMDQVPIELNAILREVEKALEAKLYYLAIAVALSVPDICASLEFDPDKPQWANVNTYASWCETNIGSRFRNLEGRDLYYLRCGVLHFGHFGHAKAKFNRIMFIGPKSAFKAHDVVVTVDPDASFSGVSAAQNSGCLEKFCKWTSSNSATPSWVRPAHGP